MYRMCARALFGGVLLLLASGCIEMTQTITVNPDGKAKIHYDIRMAAAAAVNAQPAGPMGKKRKTVAEIKQETVGKILTDPIFKKAVAWSDVSADWLPDGRLHFQGTVYLNGLNDLYGKADAKKPGGFSGPDYFTLIKFQAASQGGDGLEITVVKDPPKNSGDTPDPSKMSDKELDEYVMEQRVQYQASKPLFKVMFEDLKLKTIFQLPGEIKDAKGFKKMGDRSAVLELDGNALVAALHKFMAQDNASLKKKLKQARMFDDPASLLALGLPEGLWNVSLTVGKGKSQFDFASEVQDARKAYPMLRKQWELKSNALLPGESGIVPK